MLPPFWALRGKPAVKIVQALGVYDAEGLAL